MAAVVATTAAPSGAAVAPRRPPDPTPAVEALLPRSSPSPPPPPPPPPPTPPAVDVVLIRELAPAADVREAVARLSDAVASAPATLHTFTSGLVRFEVPLPAGAADALRWLRGQPRGVAALQPRAFFSPRRAPSGGAAPGAAAAGAVAAGAGAFAAAGSAWLWGAQLEADHDGGVAAWRPGADPAILPAALAGAAPFLSNPAAPAVRLLVAGRFDPAAAPGPEWAPFGRGLAFIPRLEYVEGGPGDALACTLAWRGAGGEDATISAAGCGPPTLALAVAAALAALASAGDAAPHGSPAPVAQLAYLPTHTPSADGWAASLAPVHAELAAGREARLGVGEATTAAPPRPASLTPSPAAADMARGEYLANGAAGLEALLAGAAAAAEAEAGRRAKKGEGEGEAEGEASATATPPPTTPPLSKVVLARRTDAALTSPGLDPLALVAALAARDERAYQFAVEVPGGASFLGSSPEQLFSRTGGAVASEAVAGTRPRAPAADAEADFWLAYDLLRHPKDHAEFAIVRDWVRGALASLCVPGSVRVERSKGVLKQGGVQHLHARLAGVLDPGRVRGWNGAASPGAAAPQPSLPTTPDAALLAALHPTPAVCGRPRSRARDVLSGAESFDRGLYAGPVGWVSAAGAEFAVAIRSALAHQAGGGGGGGGGARDRGGRPTPSTPAPPSPSRSISLYAGVGIVSGSDADAEWAELELKTGTVGALLPGWPAAHLPVQAGGAQQQQQPGGGGGPPPPLPPPLPPSPRRTLSTPPTPTLASAPNINALAARALVEELCRAGCTTFCVAPGSRSSPLALAAARHPTASVVRGLDERSLAFYAVGAARGGGGGRGGGPPVALITTSGSAVANLFPAVMEASATGVPLLLLTADRPAELRDTGANQTANQAGLFGGYVRWGADLPPPCGGAPLRSLLSAAGEAVARSQGPGRPGPVHLNLQYREPLGPEAVPYSLDPADAAALAAWWAAPGGAPFTLQAPPPAGELAPALPPALASLLSHATRGLVVLGEARSAADAAAGARIGAALGWPVACDVLSGCRPLAGRRQAGGCAVAAGPSQQPAAFFARAPDGVLAGGAPVWGVLCPDVILQVGARLTSKRVASFLEWAAVGRHGGGGGGGAGQADSSTPSPPPPPTTAWALVDADATRHDPAAATSLRSVLDPTVLARGLEAWREQRAPPPPQQAAFSAAWAAADGAACRALSSALDPACSPSAVGEPAIARAVLAAIPPGHALFLGNSMPVRDADLFGGVPFNAGGGGGGTSGPGTVPWAGGGDLAPPSSAWGAGSGPPPPGVAEASLALALPPGTRYLGGGGGGLAAPLRAVAAARGVSGIDGVLSAAAGFAAGARRPATLLIGDLSFLHDTNGLALLRDGEGRPPLTVVVVNNSGGGVFSLVAVGSQVDAPTLDEVWATPQRADLGALCRAHGVPHQRVEVGSGEASDGGGLGALHRALGAAWALGGHSVVEVVTPPRAANADAHRRLAGLAGAAAAEALAGWQEGALVVEGAALVEVGLPLVAPLAAVRRGGRGAAATPPAPPSPPARPTLLLTLTAISTRDGHRVSGVGEIAPLPGVTHAESLASAAAQAHFLGAALAGTTLPPDGARLEGALGAWIGGALGGGPGSSAHLAPSVRAGVEAAALGALAAAAGVGVAELLGGKKEGEGEGGGRPAAVRVQALLEGTAAAPPADLAAAAAALVAAHGYDTLKLKVGRRPGVGGPEEDAAAVAAVARAVGPGVVLRADANRAWSVPQAAAFASALSRATGGAPPSHTLAFVEEPLSNPSPGAWEALADALTGGVGGGRLLPIALDETIDEAVSAAASVSPGSASPTAVAAAVGDAIASVTSSYGAAPVAAIIKPSAVGGAEAAAAAARAAAAGGCAAVASSAFESSVGLWGIAGLVAGGVFGGDASTTAHGLGTAAWFSGDVGPEARPGRLASSGAGLEVAGGGEARPPLPPALALGPGVTARALARPPPAGTPTAWEVDGPAGRFRFAGSVFWVGGGDVVGGSAGTPRLTLLLLPGWMGAAADWAPVAAALAAAYPGVLRCAVVDPPCHGGSGPVGDAALPPDLESAAGAVAALARQLSSAGSATAHPVTLVGYSLGARLALAAAAGDPGAGAGGGVVCVSGGSPGLAPGRGGRPGRAARDASLAASLMRAAATPADLHAWVTAWYAGPLWAPLRGGAGPDGMEALVQRRVGGLLLSGGGGGAAGAAHALAAWSPGRAKHLSPPAIAALSASAGPVLFVAGSLDGRAAGAASAVGAVADAAVGVVAVPGVGHALLSEAPGAVVGALASWVDAQIRSE